MDTDVKRTGLLMMLFAVGMVATLLALVGAHSARAASRTFVPALNSPLAVGEQPTTVTNADFDNDGKMDLAAQNLGSDSVAVRLGNGDGTFQAKPDVTVGIYPTSVAGANLNDDGKVDLAVTHLSSNDVSIVLGNGDGTFQVKPSVAVGATPASVIGADFNRDGYTDLAAANYNSDNVSVLLGQDANNDGKADGTFRAATNFSIFPPPCSGCDQATSNPNQVIAADFNGDNKADLATANLGDCSFSCYPGGVSVLLGKGDGTFQNATLAMSGPAIPSIDADDSGDIVAANYSSNAVSVLKSNGDGTFQPKQDFPAGTNPSAVTSEDLDGDGVEDLAVSNITSDDVSVLWGNATGGFQSAQNIAAGDGPIFVISARLNADDLADLAVANEYSGNVSVLLNTAVPPETSITSGPPRYARSTSASISFSSSVANSTFKCSLDGSSFTACASPKGYSNLAQGSHAFRVRAIDDSNNPDPTPASRSWFVDTVLPRGTISINGGNASTSRRSVTLKLSASDPSPASGVASMRFRNGGTTTWSSWSAYSTSKSWTLTAGAGAKTVYVQYKDRAGNISAAASDAIRFSP